MAAWLVWLLAAGVFAIAEVFTLTFVLVMIAGGAAAGAVVAALGGPVELQLVVAIAVSLGLIWGVRPVARRHMLSGSVPASGSERLIGQRAVVLRRVDEHDGRVRLSGGEWSARTSAESQVFEPGTSVLVVNIDGATAVVDTDPGRQLLPE